MKILALALCIVLPGCSIFEYHCRMTPKWTIEGLSNAEAVAATPDEALPLQAISSINPYGFVLEMLANAGAVDATKVLAIAVAGDPASITAWHGHAVYEVEVTKRFFVIEWNKSR